MNKRYFLLVLIAVGLGVGMLFMPSKNTNSYSDKKNNPETLLASIDDPSRFLTTDDITDRLIKKDPALLLIDVRTAEQFNAFAIPGAINIPIDSLLNDDNIALLKQAGTNKVFYSNSGSTSDQAWILAKREGINHVFVMADGINTWFKNIVKAQKPADYQPKEAFDLYSFRVAAYAYFYGAKDVKLDVNAANVPEKKSVIVKKVKTASGGGC